MKIQFKTLAQFAKVGDLKMSIPTILRITHRSYCGPMTVKGMCQECPLCKNSLAEAFTFNGIPNNAEALLTWKLKNAVAINQERYHQRTITVKLDRFGLPVSEDPLAGIVKELNSEIERRELERETPQY